MKNLKNNKMLLGIGITFLLLTTISMSYAWFSATVKSENGHDQIVSTGTLELTYTDGTEIKLENARPGATAKKTIIVKNTGTLETSYNLVWQVLKNEITNNEMVMSVTCQRLKPNGEEEEKCEGLDETPITGNMVLKGRDIPSGYSHEYTVTVTFKELSKDQNYNQGKSFMGVLGIDEYKETKPIYCNFEGDLVQGTEFIKGKYTYRYMQEKSEADIMNLTFDWKNKTEEGWGVALTNPLLTDDIETSDVCTYINDKPVIFMGGMFALSQSKKIDLSNLDTSNVISMTGMFGYSQSPLLDLSNLDTSKVTDMTGMFYNSKATSIDVSNFNTSNVTDMMGMFSYSKATSIDVSNFITDKVTNMSEMFRFSATNYIDLSGFNTSNVTNMSYMFSNSEVTEIKGLENFDTSKVEKMDYMFQDTKIGLIDVSNFDTSNVTNMDSMFQNSKATEIKGLNSWNTSNVESMGSMFDSFQGTSLDLSSFDTSKVTYMNMMFMNSSNLKTIYASDKFDVTNVTTSGDIFSNSVNLVGGNGTKYDSTKTDKTYARIDTADTPGYFTKK